MDCDLLDGKNWKIVQQDCIEFMPSLPPACVDHSVFSPPFPSLYSYTSEACDIGNSEDLQGEAKIHLSYFYRQIARIVKPGRVIMVHVMQIPKLKRTGEAGTCDFRGLNIRLGQRCGLVYEYDWLVSKNPQTEAVRTHSHSLQFASLDRDRAVMRGQFGDYMIKFRAPGENKVPVNSKGDVSRNEWIAWAESHWDWRGDYSIRQSKTLNTSEGKGENDTKHICPLQLDIIERCVKLYSNPGELIFSPFAGIGSEGYEAVLNGRKFLGCEIKDEYVKAAEANLKRAEKKRAENSRTLLDGLEDEESPIEAGPCPVG